MWNEDTWMRLHHLPCKPGTHPLKEEVLAQSSGQSGGQALQGKNHPKSASCLVPFICILVPFQKKQTLFSRYDNESQKLSPFNLSK